MSHDGLRPFIAVPKDMREWMRWMREQVLASVDDTLQAVTARGNTTDKGVKITSGSLDMQDNDINRPVIEDYAIKSSSPSISSGVIIFDFSISNAFEVALTANITSVTLSNPPPSGTYGEIIIKFIQDGTGSRTVAGWASGVDWPGGTAPTITTTLTTGTDIIVLKTWDAGTTYYGDYSQDYS